MAGTIQRSTLHNQHIATPHQSCFARQLPPGGSRGWLRDISPFNGPGASSHLGREDNILPYGGWVFWPVPFNEVHSITNISPPLISLASQDSFPPGEAGGGCGTFHRSTGLVHHRTWAGRLIASPTGRHKKPVTFQKVTGFFVLFFIHPDSRTVPSGCCTRRRCGCARSRDWQIRLRR